MAVWSEEHEQYLIDNLGEKTYVEMADTLGRTEKSVSEKVRRMGMQHRDYKLYTLSDELRILELRRLGWSLEEIAKELGVSCNAMKIKLFRLRRHK